MSGKQFHSSTTAFAKVSGNLLIALTTYTTVLLASVTPPLLALLHLTFLSTS